MKKFLSIFGLGCIMSVGVLCIQPKALVVRAEEQTEVVEEEPSWSESITQTCKDSIEFMKQLFSQPLVIAGVSTTVGALALLIISKAIGGVNRKKLESVKKELIQLKSKIEESVSKKDYNELVSEKDELVQILEKFATTIKNVKLRNELKERLVELEPIKEQVVEFVKEEHEVVKSDTKQEVEVVKNDIVDILKKD